MKSTWFKMYRSIIDWEWFKEHDMTCFFLYCLSKANVQDRMWRGVLVKRGQLLVSRSTVCRELGIEERRYRTIISRLQKTGEIEVDTTGPSTLITIRNWENYQADYIEECDEHRPMFDQQPTLQRPSENIVCEVVSACNPIKEESKESVRSKSTVQPQSSTLDLFFEGEKTPDASQKKSKPDIDYDFIVRLYHDRCPDFPKILKVTDKRKTRIRLWYEDVGKDYEKVQEIFDRAQSSRFLKGDNNRGWKADFDWITNKTNWVKILEGKYDDKDTTQYYSTNEAKPQDRYAKRRGADSAADSSEDYTDSL